MGRMYGTISRGVRAPIIRSGEISAKNAYGLRYLNMYFISFPPCVLYPSREDYSLSSKEAP